MSNAPTIDALAVRVRQAVRDEREEHREAHDAWIGIDCLQEFLGIDDLRLVDAALTFASAKGLVLREQGLSEQELNLVRTARFHCQIIR